VSRPSRDQRVTNQPNREDLLSTCTICNAPKESCNLRSGLQDKLIKLVQVGDAQDASKPRGPRDQLSVHLQGTPPTQWTGYVDTEHGTSSTAEHAMNVVRKMAEEN
jgi:hypothetical protein